MSTPGTERKPADPMRVTNETTAIVTAQRRCRASREFAKREGSAGISACTLMASWSSACSPGCCVMTSIVRPGTDRTRVAERTSFEKIRPVASGYFQ